MTRHTSIYIYRSDNSQTYPSCNTRDQNKHFVSIWNVWCTYIKTDHKPLSLTQHLTHNLYIYIYYNTCQSTCENDH